MTPEQQRKADQLALVAAPMFVAMVLQLPDGLQIEAAVVEFERVALASAARLQKAAEERVSHE